MVNAHEAAEPVIHLAGIGIGAGPIVAAAMLVFLGILVWRKVPAMITRGLDKQIASIAKELADAKALRAEAEALRAAYAERIAGAEAEARDMLQRAQAEALAIAADAEARALELIRRRERLADDTIATAERAVIDELRRLAARTATAAARQVIAAHHGPDADRAAINSVIGDLAH